MSSRVQKGGTLFRPVVKQRRQGSDLTSKLGPSSSAPVHSSETPNTMQPPSSIPQRLETPALSLASEQQDADDPQTWLSSMEPQRAIPNIVTAKISTPISVGFSRKPATPISIGSRSSSIPILPSPMPTPISAPSRPTDVDLLTEPHPRNTLPLETTSNDITQSSRIPPPGPLSLSTPQKKRPVSALEPESSPTSSPRKRVRRSQRQTTGKSNPGKKISRGTLTPAPERSPGSTPEPAEGTETETTPKPPRNRSRTKKSPIAYDPNLPGIELDPTVVTMASICVDTGQGRVSSKANEIMKNHLVWKTANRERRAQMVVEMEAKKYGKSNDSGDASNGPPTLMTPPPQIAINGPAPASGPIAGGSDFDYSQNMSASKFNVQVRIGPNGETVVDEESLYVDNSGEHDTHDYTHVEESDTTKFVNSATHSKKLRGSRWSAMETELFYDALSQFGENYELISYVLPGRDRKACKNKFKAEDRRDSTRINQCLKNRTPYDIQTLARVTGKDFSGPVPIIKAPTPLKMVEDDSTTQEGKDETPVLRKKSHTPGVQPAGGAEEVLGDVDDYEDND